MFGIKTRLLRKYHKIRESYRIYKANKKYKDEKSKYRDIYAGDLGASYERRHGEGYGQFIWGGGIIETIKSMELTSICDVGCGAGKFCAAVADFIPTVYGVDIASVVTGRTIPHSSVQFLDGEAKQVPLPDKSVDLITSFDCLEHCPEEDILPIFHEFKRVARRGFVLSVSSDEDSHDGVILHLTVKPQEWWVNIAAKFGTVKTFGKNPYTNVPYIICVF